MTITDGQSGIRAIALEQLQVSHTGSQDERRKHFDQAAMAELAESIKSIGLLSPIIARPVNGHFEVVAGERRLVAAKAAGLAAISVDVRTLSDEQVLEIQLVENLQREGLHPLAEAEGYQALLKFGHNADEIAEKLGQSRGYVYARMKLLALCADARKAFYEGKFPASSALLLARIPMPVQLEALREMTSNHYDDAPMSFREVKRLIQETYMLRLADASFPTGDAELLPKAGACGPCPKRTGNQPELFEDVKGKDLCTDPVCFKLKREAWAKRQIVDAKEAGRQVIVGAQAKEIAPYGDLSFAQGYTRLNEKCWDDPKNRTYKQILGKDAQTVLVQLPKGGDLVELVQKSDAIKKLKADGVIKPLEQPKHSSPTASNKIEAAFREALFTAIHAKAPKKLSREVLETVIEHELDAIGELPNVLTKAWGWDAHTTDIEKLSEPQLNQFLFELCVVEELNMSAYAQTPKLLNLAKSMQIDTKKIRKEVSAAAKPAKNAKAKKK